MPKLAAPAAIHTNVVTLGRLGFDRTESASATRLLSQPKRLAVLLYVMLAQRGGALSREHVVGVFWPESDEKRASNALRQTLSFLRNCLGADAVVGVGARGLAVAAHVQCDAVQFDSLLDAGRLEAALHLYSGDFLSGFHVEGTHDFTEWMEGRRRHYAQRAAKAAWDLSADCEGRGEPENAAFWGKRALSLSPFSESEVQRVLRLLVRVGDHAGALRAYHGLQQQLHDEFGAAPSAETARLAAEVMKAVNRNGQQVAALLGTRRTGVERRHGERRRETREWTGVERRGHRDRRTGERRSGQDRRTVR